MRSNNALALRFSNVGVTYHRFSGLFKKERFWAVRGASFDLYHGETLGIIGKNGAGKSTILRLLAGIISPDEGRVENHGASVSLLSLRAGFVRYLTGRENVIFGGMLLGLSKAELLERMDEIESYADIGEFFDQPVSTYSTGMLARVGFSLVIHCKTDIILLDEVLGVGDADFKKKSSETMKQLIASDRTVVLVSHNDDFIKSHCDRVIWINNKKAELEGEAEEVVESYRNENKVGHSS